jgi:predicted metal-dependent enzyme (double-stranded beta helix superfamily)
MKLHEFCREFSEIVKDAAPEWMDSGRELIGRLAAEPHWFEEILEKLILDPEFIAAQKDSIWPNEIKIFSGDEFTVLAYFWEPYQEGSIHDHGSWGMAGVLAQTIVETKYDRLDDGTINGYAELIERKILKLERGQSTLFLPLNEGIHRIENCGTGVGITVNVYGKSVRRGGYVQFFDLHKRTVRKAYRPSRLRQILTVRAIRDMLGSSADDLLRKGLEDRVPAAVRKEIESVLKQDERL